MPTLGKSRDLDPGAGQAYRLLGVHQGGCDKLFSSWESLPITGPSLKSEGGKSPSLWFPKNLRESTEPESGDTLCCWGPLLCLSGPQSPYL